MEALSRRYLLILFLVFWSFASPHIATADTQKIGLNVMHSGDDVVGKRLAFAVKEEIRKSQGYILDASPAAIVRIMLVTLDPNRGESIEGSSTVASMTLVMRNMNPFQKEFPQSWYPIYLTSAVQICGSSRVSEVAQSILASVDESIGQYQLDAQRTD